MRTLVTHAPLYAFCACLRHEKRTHTCTASHYTYYYIYQFTHTAVLLKLSHPPWSHVLVLHGRACCLNFTTALRALSPYHGSSSPHTACLALLCACLPCLGFLVLFPLTWLRARLRTRVLALPVTYRLARTPPHALFHMLVLPLTTLRSAISLIVFSFIPHIYYLLYVCAMAVVVLVLGAPSEKYCTTFSPHTSCICKGALSCITALLFAHKHNVTSNRHAQRAFCLPAHIYTTISHPLSLSSTIIYFLSHSSLPICIL